MAACSAGGGAPKAANWQQRLLGKQLVRCAGQQDRLLTAEATRDCGCLGLYFSFVDPGASCDDFTRHLLDLYSSLNSGAGDKKVPDDGAPGKRLEVVHVLLWSNAQDVLDPEESFRGHVAELPWLAVPCEDYERKVSERERV